MRTLRSLMAVAFALGITLTVAACWDDDSSGDKTATVSNTGTAAVPPTRAPDGTPEPTLIEVVPSSPLKKSTHQAGELLSEDTGIAFMDTNSGAVEFWSLVHPPGVQESPQLSQTGDGKLLVLYRGTSPVRHYLVRRDTGAAYELKGGWAPDASIGFGHVIGVWKGTDNRTLGLLDVASGAMTQTAITLDAHSNLSRASSPDGTVFVVGNGAEFVLVSAETGAQELLKDGSYSHLVSPLPHGKGFGIAPKSSRR